MPKSLQEKSKFLSFVLRHRPESIGLKLDAEGWASIDALIAASVKTKLTKEELFEIVATDEKKRYSIDAARGVIRANQGHSTNQVKLSFQKKIPPAILYHGADGSQIDAIFKQGLISMKRHYVHLSADRETAESVGGRRKGGFVLLQVDCKAMVRDKFSFYISDNGVWLINQVPSIYLSQV